MGNKTVGILFSGGLDSTYLMWKNLKEGNSVRPIYITIGNNGNKVQLEKNRIELIRKEMVEEFKHQTDSTIHTISYIIDILVNSNMPNIILKQPPIWMLGILSISNIDEIQVGYVANDDMISYIDDFKKLYNSYKFLMVDKIPIKFPLIKSHKIEMYRELPEQYKNLIVTCENPKITNDTSEIIEFEPCCVCDGCNKIISLDYYGTTKFPNNYKMNLLRRHAYFLEEHDFIVTDKNGNNYWDQSNIAVESKKIEPCQLEINFNDNLNNSVIPIKHEHE